MYCKTCGYLAHEGCCEGCIGHTTDGYCVTEELLKVQTEKSSTAWRIQIWQEAAAIASSDGQ
jgi:hypothetical protein